MGGRVGHTKFSDQLFIPSRKTEGHEEIQHFRVQKALIFILRM